MDYIKKMFDMSGDKTSRTTRHDYWMTILFLVIYMALPVMVLLISIGIGAAILGFGEGPNLDGDDDLNTAALAGFLILNILVFIIPTLLSIIMWRPYHSMLHRRFNDVNGPRWVAGVVQYSNLIAIVLGALTTLGFLFAFAASFASGVGSVIILVVLALVWAVGGLVAIVQAVFGFVAFIYTLLPSKPEAIAATQPNTYG